MNAAFFKGIMDFQIIEDDEVKTTIERIPPEHRLSYLLSRFMINDYSPYVDIVPGLKDYLSKSGIFEGYDV